MGHVVLRRIFVTPGNPTFLPVNITHSGGRKFEVTSLFPSEESDGRRIVVGATETGLQAPTMPENILGDYNIGHGNRHDFTTYNKFSSFLHRCVKAWENGGPQYIGVLGVTSDVLSIIEENRYKFPVMRMDHDLPSQKLIIKLVGPRHEIAAREFLGEFLEQCWMIGISRRDLFFIGSGRMASRNTNRSKEPDEALRPKNTRKYASCFPTLVIEVGRSESLGQLRNDAHFWLTHTDREVRVVILIHIHANNRKLHLERWELVQHNLSRTRQSAKPTKLQELDLCLLNDGTVSVNPASATLDIATQLLFDIVPPGVTNDTVTIGANELLAFAYDYFDISK